MPKHIDREAFLRQERGAYCQYCTRRQNGNGKVVYEIGGTPCRICAICWVLNDIDDFPAADVVPVVRCRDCKHYDCDDGDCKCIKNAEWSDADAMYIGFVDYHGPEWYCADGERKDGGQNDDCTSTDWATCHPEPPKEEV